MSIKYNISDDGTIFQVKEDGSISKLGRIDESGRINDFKAVPPVVVKKKNNGYKIKIAIGIGVLVTSALIIFIQLFSSFNDLFYQKENYERQLSEKSNEVSSLQYQLNSLQKQVSGAYPFIVTDIFVGNTDKNGNIIDRYGSTIYSGDTYYLVPEVTYTGISAGERNVYVKLYTPDGSLCTGSKSPEGYSFSSQFYVYSGPNRTEILSGWGGDDKGHYGPGTYRIEIWYSGTCLKSKLFTIH